MSHANELADKVAAQSLIKAYPSNSPDDGRFTFFSDAERALIVAALRCAEYECSELPGYTIERSIDLEMDFRSALAACEWEAKK